MNRLSETEFHATCTNEMSPIDISVGRPFDFWPYFDAIPKQDFEGFDCSNGSVECAYRNSEGSFEHVLIKSQVQNVYMVLVLDLQKKQVHGHRLLNLDKEYRLAP